LTYFPNGTYGGNVFKVYYKVGGLPPAPPTPPPINPPLVIFKIGNSLAQLYLPLSSVSSAFRPHICEIRENRNGEKEVKCTPKVSL